MGSSLARVTCESSQVLLAGGQVVFLGLFRFCHTHRLTRIKMSEIILRAVPLSQNKVRTSSFSKLVKGKKNTYKCFFLFQKISRLWGEGWVRGHPDFSWVSVCVRYLWQTMLSEWSLSWTIIPFLVTVCEKHPCPILFKIFVKNIPILTWYPDRLIWVSQPAPKRIPFLSDFRAHRLIHTSTECSPRAKTLYNYLSSDHVPL